MNTSKLGKGQVGMKGQEDKFRVYLFFFLLT